MTLATWKQLDRDRSPPWGAKDDPIMTFWPGWRPCTRRPSAQPWPITMAWSAPELHCTWSGSRNCFAFRKLTIPNIATHGLWIHLCKRLPEGILMLIPFIDGWIMFDPIIIPLLPWLYYEHDIPIDHTWYSFILTIHDVPSRIFTIPVLIYIYMAVCQNLVPLVNIKIAGKWMFIPLKMVLIGIDPYPYIHIRILVSHFIPILNVR